jgi:hypothetical protein
MEHHHLNLEDVLRIGPRILQIGPQDEKLDCNWVPGPMAGGGSSIPVRVRLGSAGKGWGEARAITWGSIPRVGWGGGVAGGGARRRRRAATASAPTPARI